MARTYRKFVKCGVCTGSNTQYYRDMNRKCRTKNRQTLRNMIVNYDIETVSDIIPLGEVPIHTSWDEPTDGTFIVSKRNKKDYMYELDGSITTNHHYGTGENYWNHKLGKYLKPKNRKHYRVF